MQSLFTFANTPSRHQPDLLHDGARNGRERRRIHHRQELLARGDKRAQHPSLRRHVGRRRLQGAAKHRLLRIAHTSYRRIPTTTTPSPRYSNRSASPARHMSKEGLFVLRSTVMNPLYQLAVREAEKDYLYDFIVALHGHASLILHEFER